MTDAIKAMELLDVAEKWLEPFGVTDPFSNLWLEGYLSLKPDFRYGALKTVPPRGFWDVHKIISFYPVSFWHAQAPTGPYACLHLPCFGI
jgi:hypothetical protein